MCIITLHTITCIMDRRDILAEMLVVFSVCSLFHQYDTRGRRDRDRMGVGFTGQWFSPPITLTATF